MKRRGMLASKASYWYYFCFIHTWWPHIHNQWPLRSTYAHTHSTTVPVWFVTTFMPWLHVSRIGRHLMRHDFFEWPLREGGGVHAAGRSLWQLSWTFPPPSSIEPSPSESLPTVTRYVCVVHCVHVYRVYPTLCMYKNFCYSFRIYTFYIYGHGRKSLIWTFLIETKRSSHQTPFRPRWVTLLYLYVKELYWSYCAAAKVQFSLFLLLTVWLRKSSLCSLFTQDLLELAERLGPARCQGLSKQGKNQTMVFCLRGVTIIAKLWCPLFFVSGSSDQLSSSERVQCYKGLTREQQRGRKVSLCMYMVCKSCQIIKPSFSLPNIPHLPSYFIPCSDVWSVCVILMRLRKWLHCPVSMNFTRSVSTIGWR